MPTMASAAVPAASGPPAMPTMASAAVPAASAPPAMPSFGGPPPMPAPAAGGPLSMPPTMASATVSVSGPPAMPSFGGPPAIPGPGPGPGPGSGYSPMPGTVQMPFGASHGDAAAPIMATVTGAPFPMVAPPSMPPPERYELGPEIARGGMGRVVEATDILLNRTVAFKEVLSLDPDVLRRFARETRITALLEHPSIVPLHDAGTTPGGAPFYVMRKISGRPLEHLVAAADTLPERLVLVPHLVAAAQAVAHAHKRGIVHRDIKPSNILVDELGETIVIDWGLAKVIGENDELSRIDLTKSLSASIAMAPPVTGGRDSIVAEGVDTDQLKTRAGIVFGTPGFMAPEQLRGHPVTERCDVYALGATLYHVLCRKPPHHAKTADEMMQAAARRPPTPIAELVPGVPPELSTIVDKALAFDPEQRYPDARALAEDLQRFLSGQLVRSHHYTTREKLVRFIRKNRVPVTVSAAATLALIIGGTIAVTRVVNERDRADAHAERAERERNAAETAREDAVRRADQLTLTQARVEVETDPTHAIAMLKPLAEKHWLEVRAIAAAAHAHGVAHGLPAAKITNSLKLSGDGTRAVAAGVDGAIRIYDLPKRTHRAIPTDLGPKVWARFADEDRRIVAWNAQKITVLDAATGAARSVAPPTKIRDLEVAGTTAHWVDDQDKLWQLDVNASVAGAAPVAIPLPEPVTEVAPSPDGRFLALFGRDHLLLLDRSRPPEPPIEVMAGQTFAFDWSTDGTEFGALIGQHAVFGMIEAPYIMQKTHVGTRFHVVHGVDRLYAVGPTGVGTVMRDDFAPRRLVEGEPVGLAEARGGTIVAASGNRIVVLSPYGDHVVPAPAIRLTNMDASPRSPYVIGSIDDRVLVWNLDDIQPRRVLDQPPSPVFLLGGRSLIAGFLEDETAWLDLVTGKATPLGDLVPSKVFASPSGQLACAIDAQGAARLVTATGSATPLPGTFDSAGFVSEHELLLGNGTAGSVVLHDTRSGQRQKLVAARGVLRDLAWSRGAPWAAGLFAGGMLWRKNLATGVEATTSNVTTDIHLQVLRDGTVLFAEDRAIRAWRPSGLVEKHAELPRKIVTIGLAGDGHLLAVLEDDAAWLVDLAAPNKVEETESIGTSVRRDDDPRPKGKDKIQLSMAADTGTLVIPHAGGVRIVDAPRHFTWTLSEQPPSPSLHDPSTTPYTQPRISTDGTRVIAKLPTGLVTWAIPMPPGPAETAKWVESLTNAAIDTERSLKLIWR
jgi:serine/threonine protein kinase